MPSACYTGAESGTVPGSTDGLYVKIHNPAMYFNNITGDPSACAKVVPLTTGTGGTFDPNALPAFSYVVPNNCNNMHTQSTGTCPAYFGTNPNADKITMGDNWLANFVPTIASKATVILTWDEGSATSPQQIVTLEYGLGVSSGTNNASFNHFNLLGGLETAFGVPLIAGAIGQTPLPIESSPPPLPTITSFSPTSGPVGTSVTINGTGFTGASDVKFHGTSVGAGNFTVNSDVKITATVPVGATDGTISVTTPGGTATSGASFDVTPSPPPTITSFSPTSGPVGTSVTINGTGFTGASDVKFNNLTVGAGNFTVNSDIKITATVPAGATTGLITVVRLGWIRELRDLLHGDLRTPPDDHELHAHVWSGGDARDGQRHELHRIGRREVQRGHRHRVHIQVRHQGEGERAGGGDDRSDLGHDRLGHRHERHELHGALGISDDHELHADLGSGGHPRHDQRNELHRGDRREVQRGDRHVVHRRLGHQDHGHGPRRGDDGQDHRQDAGRERDESDELHRDLIELTSCWRGLGIGRWERLRCLKRAACLLT